MEESSRNVALSFQNQPAVGRFDFSRANDPACLVLDAQGQNPCISHYFLPHNDPDTQHVHSVATDGAGNVWVSQAGPQLDCSTLTSVGFLQATTNRVLMFPPLSFYPQGSTCTSAGGRGLAYDPTSGGMWFAEFFRHRLGRIRLQ